MSTDSGIASIPYTRPEPIGEINTEHRYFMASAYAPHQPGRILRAANTAVNFTSLQQFALDLLKNGPSLKASIRRKQ